MVCCGDILTDFAHVVQGWITAIVLPKHNWSYHTKYEQINHTNRLITGNITISKDRTCQSCFTRHNTYIPWFPSRSSVLIYIYIYICMCIPYTSSVIGRIYNGSVIQYWRSCTPSRSFYRIVFLGSARFLGWMPLFVFLCLPIVSSSLIKV